MIVGVVAYRYDHYSYVRNIVSIVPGVEYRKARDLYAWINATARSLNRTAQREVISTFDLNNQFCDLDLNRVDLLHLFNGVSYCHTPWISTFETILPRIRSFLQVTRDTPPGTKKDGKPHPAMKALAGPNCKQLIALSDCAAKMQRELLSSFSTYAEIIDKKMTVMHPPQKLFMSSFDEKGVSLDGRIKFMMVGNAFFRKGGPEILAVMKKLRDQYQYDLELIVVSNLSPDGYVMPVTPEVINQTRIYLQENRAWITYYPQLPNDEVLELMKKAHIGMLPTYADTYGYSVLEFQACGCPVITTDVRSLPEINDNDKGWIIHVPKNHLGEATYDTETNRNVISQAICVGLEAALHNIFAERSVIPLKSNQSILSIKTKHSLTDFSARTKNIYLDALRSI
jgi:glycosyltransferase involved in cell wall biosynthesis